MLNAHQQQCNCMQAVRVRLVCSLMACHQLSMIAKIATFCKTLSCAGISVECPPAAFQLCASCQGAAALQPHSLSSAQYHCLDRNVL